MKVQHLILIAGLSTGIATQGYAAPDSAALKGEAISIVKRFGGSLKPELKKALKSGGPANAIGVCSEKAPEIAENLSKDTGWNVKRVSLKPRNDKSAIPDAWEQKVLAEFDRRQAAGEKADKMAFGEMVDGQYRFMKALGTGKVCLNCHGAKVKPEVEAALQEYYPQDKARGYELGQIRGAITLRKDF
jgi:hypothetical protein